MEAGEAYINLPLSLSFSLINIYAEEASEKHLFQCLMVVLLLLL
jgi:hypothetical protein